jgi:molybdopterin synthase sulfur carrier subunit
MALLCLHGPLRTLSGGPELQLEGETLRALLMALEREHPATAGWLLDERRVIRAHINVYVNGERACETTPITPGDRIEVLPAISGGAP